MRSKTAAHLALLILPLILCSGCATEALWDKATLNDCNEPAGDLNLRVFSDEQKKDFLVVYSEYSERFDKIRTRAYFLDRNQKRIEKHHRPNFVGIASTNGLPTIPVFSESDRPGILQEFYAVVSTNDHSFTLFSAGQVINSYRLPVYDDGVGMPAKIFLTPPAVVADVTVVGGYFWVMSGCPGLECLNP